MKRSTTMRSRTRDRTGTTVIGRKSPGPFGGFILATGRIRATRHCSGIVDEFRDELNSRAIHLGQAGASRWRNQAGMLSRPWCGPKAIQDVKDFCFMTDLSIWQINSLA